MANSTWDAATATAVTLSGGNLVATNTGTTSTNQGTHVAFANGLTTGKYYFEVTLTNFAAGAGVGVGVGNTSATYAGMSVQATNGAMCYMVGHTGSGTIFTSAGGNTGLSIGARTTGNVIGVALDLTNSRVWFRAGAAGNWNGIAGNNPSAPPGTGGGVAVVAGTIVPFVTFGSGLTGQAGVAGNVFTANFGDSAFVGTVPSGFTAGFPAPSPPVRSQTAVSINTG